jgi:predicted phage terminase large subunit-like protein
MTAAPIHNGPQKGPQMDFFSTPSDIAIFGGAAGCLGGGKSYALLLEPLRHFHNSKFSAVIFRRNSTMVRNVGGLWQDSTSIYAPLKAHPREAYLEWIFPSGMKVKFAHLENESTVYDWQGSQIPFIGFDELVHFTEKQFWYLLSRLRSTSGVAGYVRATCNPDCDSWVRPLIDWWIDSEGYPIPEKSGKLRWFIRRDDSLIWGDSQEELKAKYGDDESPKSFTFIPSKLTDNAILMEKDPSYLSNLKALSRVERMRLLAGNWNVRATAGMMFQREWFPVVDAVPQGWTQAIRTYDRAATKPNEVNKDPDWTRGLLLYKYPNNTFIVADLKSLRDTPGQVENLIRNVAAHDGRAVQIVSQQDPGSAGVAEAENFTRMLSGYNVKTVVLSKDTVTRAKPVSAQVEAGNIKVLRAPWNGEFFTELENFPEGRHDDIVDCLSMGFNILSAGFSILNAL